MILISPAKSMNSELQPGFPFQNSSNSPEFEREAEELSSLLSAMTDEALAKLFKSSPAKTAEIREKLNRFGVTPNPALLLFTGTAFKALNCASWTPEEQTDADGRLRIFSGLYGILKPSDRISAYRLDLNDPLRPGGVSLKKFWKEKVCGLIRCQLAEGERLFNLASNEYSSLLDKALLNQTVNFEFRIMKNGKMVSQSVASKQARGLFASELIRRKDRTGESLISRPPEGWSFREELSEENRLVFLKN